MAYGGTENEQGRPMREELADTHRERTGETTMVEQRREEGSEGQNRE